MLPLFAQWLDVERALSGSGGTSASLDREWTLIGDADNNTVHAYRLDYSNFQWVSQGFPTAPKQGLSLLKIPMPILTLRRKNVSQSRD